MQVPGAVVVPAAGGHAHRGEAGFTGLADGVTVGVAGLRAEHAGTLLAAEDRYRLLGSGNLSARFRSDLIKPDLNGIVFSDSEHLAGCRVEKDLSAYLRVWLNPAHPPEIPSGQRLVTQARAGQPDAKAGQFSGGAQALGWPPHPPGGTSAGHDVVNEAVHHGRRGHDPPRPEFLPQPLPGLSPAQAAGPGTDRPDGLIQTAESQPRRYALLRHDAQRRDAPAADPPSASSHAWSPAGAGGALNSLSDTQGPATSFSSP